MMRFALCLLVLIPAAGRAQAREPASDTIRVSVTDAIGRALRISPDVLAGESGIDYAAARLDLARASRFVPEFRATTAHSVAPALSNPNGTPLDELYLDSDVRNDWNDLRPFNRIDVNAVQPIWTWGEINGNIDAARGGVAVERQSVRTNRIEVAVRTGRLYYGLVLAEALERLTGEASDVVQKAKDEISRLLEQGDPDVDDADMFQVQITEQEFNRRVVEVTERLATARAGLRRQLMVDDAVIEPTDLVLEPLPYRLDSLEVYLEMALSERPEPARADAGIAARQALLQVARSAYYPKLFVGVEARYSGADGRYRQHSPYLGDPFLSRSVRAGLGLRLELNFLQTRSKVEQARAQLDQVVHQSDAARQLVLYEVESAYRTVIVRKAAVDAAEQSLQLSKDWLRTEQVNFDYDLGNTENLVDAVRTNLELQAARHQAVYEYNVAVLGLLAASGLMDRPDLFGTFLE